MKHALHAIVLIAFSSLSGSVRAAEVTTAGLLSEMTDLARLAR